MKLLRSFILILLIINCISCRQQSEKTSATKPSFKSVTGIRFTEIRRAFDSGFSFDKRGYQLEPEWKMYILSDDSAMIYTPAKKRYMPYKIYFDHDSVINMGWVWLRIKKVSKDSLRFQVLEVEGKEISRERSNLYMTFYADPYIKNVLHTNAQNLQKPSTQDSAYVRSRIRLANQNPDSAFAARQPVVLKSNSPIIKIKKLKPNTADLLNDADPTDEYVYPKFNITINRAYKDFNYSFSVLVDEQGRMRFGKSRVYIMPEFEESKIRVMKGIIDVYLQRLLTITPGKTLGIPHKSQIYLNVKGVSG